MDGFRDLLVIAVVVAISGTAVARPFVGLLSFVVFAIVNPHSLAWSISSTFPPALPIAVGTILGYIISSEPKRLPPHREVHLLLALWCVFVVSTSTAVYPAEAFPMLTQVSKILLMVCLSLAMVNTKERLLQLSRTVTLSLGYLGLKAGIFAIRTGGQDMVWGPDNSFLYANNSIGVALAMNLPMLFHLRRLEHRRWLRYVMTAMMFLSYPAIVCTFSRGAWLSAAAATAFMMWRSRHRWVTAAAVVVLAIPVLSSQMLPDRVVNRYEDLAMLQEEESAGTRLWTWEYCRRVGFANPLTGAGFNFVSVETWNQYYPEFLAWHHRIAACHGTAMTVLGEHGFPGFLLWIGLLGSCVASATRIRRAASRAGADGVWVVAIADMLLAAFAAYMVGGMFVDLNYFDIFYQLIAMVVMLKVLAPQIAASVTTAGAVVAGTRRRP